MKHIHGGDIYSFKQSFPDRTVWDFSANINPLGMPESSIKALADCGEAVLHYPDPSCQKLKAAVAEYEAVSEDWLLCTNGAADMISRIVWSMQPKTALVLSPTFAEYERSLTAVGCDVRHYDLHRENGFALNEEIIGAISGNDMMFLCSPNNPTGQLVQPQLMSKIVESCAEKKVLLVIDECFLDFVPDGDRYSAKRYLEQYGNIVIVRAFTKFFAMPGLRLGYGICSDSELLGKIAQAGGEWAVSVPAQLCGIKAVEDSGYIAKTKEIVPQWREYLEEQLKAVGCTVYPSATNFILFESRPDLGEYLKKGGILLRDCSNFRGLSSGFFRTAVRTLEENKMLIDSIIVNQLQVENKSIF